MVKAGQDVKETCHTAYHGTRNVHDVIFEERLEHDRDDDDNRNNRGDDDGGGAKQAYKHAVQHEETRGYNLQIAVNSLIFSLRCATVFCATAEHC
jgi:hypothetical protein